MSLYVLDNAMPLDLVRAAAAAWPSGNWPHWHVYANRLESKRTCHLWEHIPEPCAKLLGLMAALPICERLGIPPAVPDLSLYGAGMHDMRGGDYLGMHLDADRHRRLGFERAANAILFVEPWHNGLGGEFCLDTCWPTLKVMPAENRLVLFDTNDRSLHGVPGTTGHRKSLALYWWRAAEGDGKRARAEFVGQMEGER